MKKKLFFAVITERLKSILKNNCGETLNLRGVIFPGDVDFANSEGVGFPEVDFSYSRFNGNADFSDVRFSGGNANFSNARFEKDATFTRAQFNGGADFRSTEFNGKADFQNTEFSNWETFFSNAKFIGHDADFQNAEFSGNTHFQNVKFRWNAIFSHARFKKSASFKEAKFCRDTYFLNSEFRSGKADFEKACFNGKADFTYSANNHDTNAFKAKVNFKSANFLGDPIFEVTFENRTFQQKTSFRDCTFEKAPRFHGCRLHQDTDFTDARFRDKQGDEAVKAYRTLKLDMEEKRAREEQLVFYALEMESRQHTTKNKLLKFISYLYGVTADYGQSIIAPFASALMVFVLSMIVYSIFFLASPIADCEKTDIVALTSRFSMEQIIRPFRASENFLSLSKCIKQASPSYFWRLGLGISTTFQSVLSFIFLGLGALAARWRFKIG